MKEEKQARRKPTIDQAYVLGGSYQDAGSWRGRVNTELGTQS